MTYTLLLGDYAYSSWSLRGWLLFEKFGIARSQHMLNFSGQDVEEQLANFPPARTVPTVVMPEGAVVSDSLAIAEELATRHPDAGLWSCDPLTRATTRSLAAEMHSGFVALRSDYPMNLRKAYRDTSPSKAVLADLARIETIWEDAFDKFNVQGPWLGGTYSAADAFFAPVAARIAGYGLPIGKRARSYVTQHLADPAFRRWRAMGLVHGDTLPWYAKEFENIDWPGPKPLVAIAVSGFAAENDACPYSGRPVTDVMELDGRRFGFCNPFCRDKTVADPEAWPDFMALLSS
ncbi:glutathione S-transferase [Shimia gijangensis]|uniref:Glutathione S-transferase n=1 Tax=Shimia gijangensis TaxID=1470563 RepID=A0A1M6FRS7_9RHOB|nr:glutathione S-transferase [Shimia gijangensis]SHJ00374.1 glutathione S-transferase [Shimia gijangensis]